MGEKSKDQPAESPPERDPSPQASEQEPVVGVQPLTEDEIPEAGR